MRWARPSVNAEGTPAPPANAEGTPAPSASADPLAEADSDVQGT